LQFREYFGFPAKAETLHASALPTQVIAPWSAPRSTPLAKFVSDDIWGVTGKPVRLARSQAMSIPAVAKARHMIINEVAKLPLKALNADGPVPVQPTFLYRTDGLSNPYDRLAMTVEDLIFEGVSLWLTDRGTNGQITRAEWVPFDQWVITTEGKIAIGQRVMQDQEVILFNIPGWDGLLTVAARTLTGARDTELAWTAVMENPQFITELRVTGEMTQTEADAYYAAWLAKHQAGSASFGMTPNGMEIHTHSGVITESDLFTASRQAIRSDIGAFLNVPASAMDSSIGEASLTYSTTEGNRNLFLEFLSFWTAPIEQALSIDKVVPRGQRVRFDKTEQYSAAPTPTGAPTED
jgi:hypothetical protein